MEQASNHETVSTATITLIALPVEVLVYIISFLSTREKVGLRFVSKTLRSACEIPSLWEEFIWLRYAPRDDKLLKSALRMFGQHIKRFHFADHIAPSKLQVMLKFCRNVLQLSLPSFNYKNIEKLKKIVSSTANLQILGILRPKSCDKLLIQQIIMLSSNLKELSLHYGPAPVFQELKNFNEQIQYWLEEWANFNYVPRKLTIFFTKIPYGYLESISTSLQSCVPTLRSKALPTNFESGHIAWFNICFKRSIDFSPVVPVFQLRVTDSSVILPSVKPSKYGILGLDYDTLHLTQGSYRGKKVYKALLTNNDEYMDTSVTSLTSVTYFDASYCHNRVLYPGHLEQLSIACPNLQTLNLRGNIKCLSNLQGLRSLATNCKRLQELNLWNIHAIYYEYSCLQLWEVLCIMCLIQLAIEAWMIDVHDNRNAAVVANLSPGDCTTAVKHQKLVDMFQNYTTLKVLEVRGTVYHDSYNNPSDNELSLVSYFPSITSYRLCNLPSNDCYHTLKQIFSCKYLRCLYLSKKFPGNLSLSLEGQCSSLQQLYINSRDTIPTEAFIDALCGHGGLEHVILCVKSLTAKSISSIIEKSPNLMTFYAIFRTQVFLKSELISLSASLKTRFLKRKLFNSGKFDLRQDEYYVEANDNSLLHDTDLMSTWNLCNYLVSL